jgi:hypothetical protein
MLTIDIAPKIYEPEALKSEGARSTMKAKEHMFILHTLLPCINPRSLSYLADKNM